MSSPSEAASEARPASKSSLMSVATTRAPCRASNKALGRKVGGGEEGKERLSPGATDTLGCSGHNHLAILMTCIRVVFT